MFFVSKPDLRRSLKIRIRFLKNRKTKGLRHFYPDLKREFGTTELYKALVIIKIRVAYIVFDSAFEHHF